MERIKKIGTTVADKGKMAGSWLLNHKVVSVCLAVLLVIILVMNIVGAVTRSRMAAVTTYDYTVERKNISNVITGTATIEPKDSYTITSLVSGEIAADYFEEGDTVTEGDLLYQIDTADVENSLQSAALSMERAQNTYNDGLKDQENLNVKASATGKIASVNVKEGDNVNQGSVIAHIYDDSRMQVEIPFNDADAQNIYVGNSASVSVVGTGMVLSGTVTKVASGAVAGAGYSLTRMVTIEVENPGALTTSNTATAVVGSYACNAAGTFSYQSEGTITAKVSGKVEELHITVGDRVSASTVVARLSSETLDKTLRNNNLSLQESRLSQERTQKQLEDYTITAPISGTVIEKNSKAGDNLTNGVSQTAMAIIYDMSELTFELSIDELDVGKIAVGQKVTFTAEALEGKEYEGAVTKVSVNGTTSNGVTAYPITVTVTEFDEALLPGMNIDASIVVEERENVLAVPVSAVNRGNTVYVKGEKETEDDGAPDGYKTVTVEIGISDADYVEILSGLKEGDLIQVTRMSAEGSDMMQDMQEMMQGGGMRGSMPQGGGMPGGMPQGGGMPGGM